MLLQIKDLQLLFDSGSLKSATVFYNSMFNNYFLEITQAKSKEKIVLASQRETTKEREFKTIDAAASAANKIGFKRVTVEL